MFPDNCVLPFFITRTQKNLDNILQNKAITSTDTSTSQFFCSVAEVLKFTFAMICALLFPSNIQLIFKVTKEL
jgi:hypothetical protein